MTLWLAISSPFRKTYQANICKHKSKRTCKVKSFGVGYIITTELTENGCPDYCPSCINKMTIQCAWCGKPIHIDDPVTLFRQPASYSVQPYAVRCKEDPDHLVGCLRLDCCVSYGIRQGFWRTPGIVERVPSPIEMCASDEGGDKLIIISDISKP